MAATYAGLAEYKTEIGETDDDNDARHANDLEEASRVIDALCRRAPGYFAAVTATRYLDVPAAVGTRLSVPPLQSVTTLKTDEDGDRTYEVTWSSTLDYRLYPLEGPPYTEVRIDTVNGRYTFPAGDARVQIVGTFGETAGGAPLGIQRATRLLANRYRARPNTPEGISTGGEDMMALGAADPDIIAILRDGGYVNAGAVFA